MAKKASTSQAETSSQADGSGAGAGHPVEYLTNKAEGVRRAVGALGKTATPTEIQSFLLSQFGIEMTTKVISVYKSKLFRKRGKRGRKRRKAAAPVEASAAPAAPKAVSHGGGVPYQDLRTIKEMRDRLGPARLRELVELIGS
jgi:hypothetical protein